jgi:hypothetical protein
VPVQSLAGGFASVKIGVSAWPTGDWTFKGLEASGWIEGFISGEAGTSVW